MHRMLWQPTADRRGAGANVGRGAIGVVAHEIPGKSRQYRASRLHRGGKRAHKIFTEDVLQTAKMIGHGSAIN